jgi:polyhydroxybutyrate depolymerase
MSSDGKGGFDCWAGNGDPFACADGLTAKKSGKAVEDFLGLTWEHYTCCAAEADDPAPGACFDTPVECIEHAGLKRCWRTYVPDTISSPVRVVMDLHGYGGNMGANEQYTGWREIADAEGVVIVWPQGTAGLDGQSDPSPSWNAGQCCGASSDTAAGVDDVGFLREVAEMVAVAHGADVSRNVYWAGHSNGCAMAQRMAAQANDIVAAVGCHAMYLVLEDDQIQTASYADKPVPVINVHGTSDQVVGYDGFPDPSSPASAMSNLARWASLNGCPTPLEPEQHQVSQDLEVSWHEGCVGSTGETTEVELLTLPGVGHTPYQGFTSVATTQVCCSANHIPLARPCPRQLLNLRRKPRARSALSPNLRPTACTLLCTPTCCGKRKLFTRFGPFPNRIGQMVWDWMKRYPADNGAVAAVWWRPGSGIPVSRSFFL